MSWYTYILRCADDTLYTGITTDLERRLEEHNSSDKGAKYTRARRPIEMLFFETYESRSEASSREYEIKQMTRANKLKLVKNA